MNLSIHTPSRLLATIVIAASLFGAGGVAQAASPATTTMTVSTSIPTTCSLGTVSNVSFPSPQTLAVAVDTTASGSLQVTCTAGGTYTVIADDGGNYDNINATRRMRKGSTGAYLRYGLYTGSARNTAFPATTATATVQTGDGTAQTITLYAKLDAQTATEAGSYTDAVTLTVTY